MTAAPESRSRHVPGSAAGSAPHRAPLQPGEHEIIAEAARWAPSIHNSQPWRLRRLEAGLAIIEDLTRSLPVIDPTGRDRTISCGAAVFNARLAMRSLGYATGVELIPDPAEPTLVASVRSGGPGRPARTRCCCTG